MMPYSLQGRSIMTMSNMRYRRQAQGEGRLMKNSKMDEIISREKYQEASRGDADSA